MSKKEFFDKLDDVLDNWRDYGYWYFIGDGTCQTKTKKGGVRNTKKTSVRRTRKNSKKRIAGNPIATEIQPSAPPLEAKNVKPEKTKKIKSQR
jgi:Cu2+-containing amine oxidase